MFTQPTQLSSLLICPARFQTFFLYCSIFYWFRFLQFSCPTFKCISKVEIVVGHVCSLILAPSGSPDRAPNFSERSIRLPIRFFCFLLRTVFICYVGMIKREQIRNRLEFESYSKRWKVEMLRKSWLVTDLQALWESALVKLVTRSLWGLIL